MKYEVRIKVGDYDDEREESIRDAIDIAWDFEDNLVSPFDNCIRAHNVGPIHDATEHQFVERLIHAVWTANDGYCRVEIEITKLANIPCNTYSKGRADYEMWQDGLAQAEQERSSNNEGLQRKR